MMPFLALVPHLLLMVAAAPVLAGLTGSGHPSAPWRELRRLFRKPGLWSEHGALIGVAPVVSLGTAVFAVCLVPSFTLGMASAPLADLVLIAALFALSRAALILACLDAESSAASLAAQRAAALGACAVPGVLVLILLIAAAGGTSNLDTSAAALRDAGPGWWTAPAVAAVCLLLLTTDRLGSGLLAPFAGRDLGALMLASLLWRLLVLSILATLLLPVGLAPPGSLPSAWVVGAALWSMKVVLLGTAAALLGHLLNRLRLDQTAELAVLGLLLALIAAALFFAGQRAA